MADNPGAITESAYFVRGFFESGGHSVSTIEWFFHRYISTGLLIWVNVRNHASGPEFSDVRRGGIEKITQQSQWFGFPPPF
jgi:hypothetical protein